MEFGGELGAKLKVLKQRTRCKDCNKEKAKGGAARKRSPRSIEMEIAMQQQQQKRRAQQAIQTMQAHEQQPAIGLAPSMPSQQHQEANALMLLSMCAPKIKGEEAPQAELKVIM